jgi:hypothetical protein
LLEWCRLRRWFGRQFGVLSPAIRLNYMAIRLNYLAIRHN